MPRGGSRAAFRSGDAPYDTIGFDCRLGAAFTNELATSQGAAPVGSPPFTRQKPAQQARMARQSVSHKALGRIHGVPTSVTRQRESTSTQNDVAHAA